MIAPRYLLPSVFATKMAVGPSAAPMTAMEAASGQVKEQPRQHQCEENAELRRRAEEHELRLFQQRAKIDHRADADEQQQREQLVGHTCVKKRVDRANGFALCDGTGQRQVDEDGTEAHRQQQARLHLFAMAR